MSSDTVLLLIGELSVARFNIDAVVVGMEGNLLGVFAEHVFSLVTQGIGVVTSFIFLAFNLITCSTRNSNWAVVQANTFFSLSVI